MWLERVDVTPKTISERIKEWQSNGTCRMLFDSIRRMTEEDGVRVFYLRGNHDHEMDPETVKTLMGEKVEFIGGSLIYVIKSDDGQTYRIRFAHGHDWDIFEHVLLGSSRGPSGWQTDWVLRHTSSGYSRCTREWNRSGTQHNTPRACFKYSLINEQECVINKLDKTRTASFWTASKTSVADLSILTTICLDFGLFCPRKSDVKQPSLQKHVGWVWHVFLLGSFWKEDKGNPLPFDTFWQTQILPEIPKCIKTFESPSLCTSQQALCRLRLRAVLGFGWK